MKQMKKISNNVFEYLFVITNKQYAKQLAKAKKSEEHVKKYYPNNSFFIEEWENKSINEISYSKGFTTCEMNDSTGVSCIYHYVIK